MSSDSDNEASGASSILESVMENLQHIPSSPQSYYVSGGSSSGGLFGHRQRRVHDLLGGGQVADVLLWRKKHLSAGVLVGTTVLWFLFEWVGYHFVSVISFVLLLSVVVLFAWSSGAAFLNRAPPPVPKLQLSDKQVHDIARNVSFQVNKALLILHEIVIGKDVTRFLKLVGVLVFLMVFGSWFQLLNLIYLAVIAAHTLPVLYDKYGDSIDEIMNRMLRDMKNQYRKFDATVLSKIPRRQPTFQKKTY